MGHSEHVGGLLFAHCLGTLSTSEATRTQLHLQSCALCAAQLCEVREDLSRLALALEPIQPPQLIRESLLHSINEINRFHSFHEPICKILECDALYAQNLLQMLNDRTIWDTCLEGSIRCITLESSTQAYLFSLEPGHLVPHDEGQQPTLLLLQGAVQDTYGRIFRAGDTLQLKADDHAELLVCHGPNLIYLARDPIEPNASSYPPPMHASPITNLNAP